MQDPVAERGDLAAISQRASDGTCAKQISRATRPGAPGRALTRNQAITAMVLAETVAGGLGDHTDKRWLFIKSWADELGMTGADAVGKISYLRTDPEAGE